MNLSSTSTNNAAKPRGSASTSTAAPTDAPKSTSENFLGEPKRSSVPPVGPSENTIVNHGNASHADAVVNQTEETSRLTASSAYKPFQSTRTIKNPPPTNSFPGSTDDNRFQPRRSAPLNVKMPESQEVVEDDGPSIPVVPTNYDSSANHPPANTLTSSPAPPPKVITISHIDTHLAAPSHPSQDVVVNPPVQVADYPIPGRPDLKNGSSSSSTEGGEGESLTSDERTGLFVLGGILAGGWLLGSFGKVSSGEDHGHAKEKEKKASH
ncbi:hypothetical protein FRB96_004370 [Tulasnella sp. 330]|nr:hypothetical protein FRB96_004370 [Tulasnella sp. 330]KAG8868228.1 hypothetical protein FRB97_002621 [Tulasnella sp. 331]